MKKKEKKKSWDMFRKWSWWCQWVLSSIFLASSVYMHLFLSFFIFHKVFSFFVCLCQYIIPLCIYKIKEIKNILFMIAKSNAWMYKHTKHKPLHSCLDFSIMQIKWTVCENLKVFFIMSLGWSLHLHELQHQTRVRYGYRRLSRDRDLWRPFFLALWGLPKPLS